MRSIRYYIDLVLILTHKELKVKYKNSFLGYLWSIGNPLAFAFVFFAAFKIIMKVQMEDYALFLIAGLFPWQWFANSVNSSPLVFLANASIIKKVNFPRQMMPISAVLQDMLHFIMAIPVIMIFMFIYHKPVSYIWLFGIPMILAVQFLLILGISLAISSINLFFRDLERLTAIFTTLLFYFTPIIYSEAMVPEEYRNLINLNPIGSIMVNWRELFLNGKIDMSSLFISFVYSILSLLIGIIVYKKLSWKFAEVL